MRQYAGLKVCAVLAALAIVGVAGVAEADFVIFLRNGNDIKVSEYRDVGNHIVYERYGGKITVPKTGVKAIKNLETGEKRVFDRFGKAQEPKVAPRSTRPPAQEAPAKPHSSAQAPQQPPKHRTANRNDIPEDSQPQARDGSQSEPAASRPCEQKDLIGAWEMTHLKAPPTNSKDDRILSEYQYLFFHKNGSVFYRSSSRPLTEKQLADSMNFPAQMQFDAQTPGALIFRHPSGQPVYVGVCAYALEDESPTRSAFQAPKDFELRGQRQGMMKKGDILLAHFDEEVKWAAFRYFTKLAIPEDSQPQARHESPNRPSEARHCEQGDLIGDWQMTYVRATSEVSKDDPYVAHYQYYFLRENGTGVYLLSQRPIGVEQLSAFRKTPGVATFEVRKGVFSYWPPGTPYPKYALCFYAPQGDRAFKDEQGRPVLKKGDILLVFFENREPILYRVFTRLKGTNTSP
jgi:hypothetical protein